MRSFATRLIDGTTNCAWDSVIPFDAMWERLNKLIKPNGAIVLFGSEPFSSALRMSNIKNYKYDWVWNKLSGMGFLDAKFRPLKSHENVSIFGSGVSGVSNGSKVPMKYNPQGVTIENIIKKNKVKYAGLHSNPSKNEYKTTGKNYPKSIIKFSKENGLHPTQKPVALMEYLIKTYTNENELVLDFTCGSGSTCIACQNLKRNFIGIEKDEKYCEIAKKRLAENKTQQTLV